MPNISTNCFFNIICQFVLALITIIYLLCLSSIQGWTADNQYFLKPLGDSSLFIENRAYYRYKSSGSYKDSDFYDYWHIGVNDYLAGTTDFYFSGLFHKDLDKTPLSYADNIFVGSNDLKSDLELYQLHGDIHTRDKLFGLRLGRQYIDWGGGSYVDGGLVRLSTRLPAELQIFYGNPVSFYGEADGDWSAGGALTIKPWRSNRSRIDYVLYYDNYNDKQDSRISLNAWQYWQEKNIATHGRFRFLNGRYTDTTLDFSYNNRLRDLDLSMVLRHGAKLGEATTFNSPLFLIYGAREPYAMMSGRVNWFPLSSVLLSTGVTWRKVTGRNNTGSNRDYQHYDLSLTYSPSSAWDFSISGEKWDITHGDQFYGITGQIAYRKDPWQISAGSSYAVYKYQRFIETSPLLAQTLGEDAREVVSEFAPDSRTFFTSVRYRWNDYLDLKLKGEMEQNSEVDNNIYRVCAEIVFRFDTLGTYGPRSKKPAENK